MRKAGDVCFAEVSRDSDGMHLTFFIDVLGGLSVGGWKFCHC